MANFTTADIKSLRERTGAGMMDAKKALDETNGDIEAAVDALRAKGLATAQKKSSRTAAEGLVGLAVSSTKGVAVEVMGVGVAGLQAIATARRLGAQVSATDVRSATREQIQSLGAKPVFVESVAGIEGEGAGGYAAEMSDEYQRAQAELVSGHIAKQDIVITTALIPGKPAPRLISDAQIASMKPGSVIFDLAVAQGGNVEGSAAGQVTEKHGVKLIGLSNTAAHLAADASALYSRNLYNFLSAFWDKEAGRPALDEEIGNAVRLTRGGEVVSERLKG